MITNKFTAVSLTVVLGVFAAVAAVVLLPSTASAAEQKKPAASSSTTNQQATPATYKYVAQTGDSYTLMARKAVQTYGKKYKVNLAPGQILYAETNMTIEAGSPHLNQGQQVELRESVVKSWIEKAQKLSADTIRNWNAYLPGVDFNTDRVGR